MRGEGFKMALVCVVIVAAPSPSVAQAPAQEHWPARGAINFGEESYFTYAEAAANPTPIPAQCLNEASDNRCVSTVVIEDVRDAGQMPRLGWRPGPWMPARLTYCTDVATANLDLPCDAPGTARTWMPPPPIVFLPTPSPRP